MVKGHVADGKPMIGLISRAGAIVQTVGTSAAVMVDMMAVGIRQDLGEVEWPRQSPQGWTLLSNSSSHKICSHARIYIFLSFFDARFAKKTDGVRRISTRRVWFTKWITTEKIWGTVDANVKWRGEEDLCPFH
jgi:hypothetical protein